MHPAIVECHVKLLTAKCHFYQNILSRKFFFLQLIHSINPRQTLKMNYDYVLFLPFISICLVASYYYHYGHSFYTTQRELSHDLFLLLLRQQSALSSFLYITEQPLS